MCDTIFAIAITVLSALFWLSKMQNERLESKLEELRAIQAEVQQSNNLTESEDNNLTIDTEVKGTEMEAIYKEITKIVQPQATSLGSAPNL